MTGLNRLWPALALALGLATAPPALAARPQPSPAQIQSTQQVLVLLRLPPGHLRPGSDYGGGYGDQLGRAGRRRIAVGLARKHGLTLVGDWPMPLLGVDCFIMAVPDGRTAEEVAAALSRDAGVSWAEASHLYRAQGSTAAQGDPLFRAQPAARAWRLADLHQIATGRGVRVAVVDSGVEANHPDLAGQVEMSRNFVADRADAPETHGTGVAGVIAAKAGNGLGMAGIAPDARLMALRACWQIPSGQGTVCDSLSLAKALHFAIDRRAQVINLSLSGPADPLLGKLLDVALARGVTVVTAFDRAAADGGFPASHAGVVAVVEDSLEAAPAGAYSAPGRDVPTTQPGGRWFLVSGSSYAAAHLSGLFALMRQRDPGARNASMLTLSSVRLGQIDACASLLRAAGPCDCACAHAPKPAAGGR